MYELTLLRAPLRLSWKHRSIEVSADGSEAMKTGKDGLWRCAACVTTMRSGRHFAQFTLVYGSNFVVGLVRPDWKGLDGSPTWTCSIGTNIQTWALPASNGPAEEKDHIAVLLDLDMGTLEAWICRMHQDLTAYSSSWERLGIVATGLSGEYSWAVLIHEEGDAVRIEHIGNCMALP
jgi:hypothetical protein